MKINKEKFEILLAENCMTITELVKIIKTDNSVIAKINKGFDKFRPATVGKIAKALNVPVIELIENN